MDFKDINLKKKCVFAQTLKHLNPFNNVFSKLDLDI